MDYKDFCAQVPEEIKQKRQLLPEEAAQLDSYVAKWQKIERQASPAVRREAAKAVGSSEETALRWLGFIDFFREVCGLKKSTEKMADVIAATKCCLEDNYDAELQVKGASR